MIWRSQDFYWIFCFFHVKLWIVSALPSLLGLPFVTSESPEAWQSNLTIFLDSCVQINSWWSNILGYWTWTEDISETDDSKLRRWNSDRKCHKAWGPLLHAGCQQNCSDNLLKICFVESMMCLQQLSSSLPSTKTIKERCHSYDVISSTR